MRLAGCIDAFEALAKPMEKIVDLNDYRVASSLVQEGTFWLDADSDRIKLSRDNFLGRVVSWIKARIAPDPMADAVRDAAHNRFLQAISDHSGYSAADVSRAEALLSVDLVHRKSLSARRVREVLGELDGASTETVRQNRVWAAGMSGDWVDRRLAVEEPTVALDDASRRRLGEDVKAAIEAAGEYGRRPVTAGEANQIAEEVVGRFLKDRAAASTDDAPVASPSGPSASSPPPTAALDAARGGDGVAGQSGAAVVAVDQPEHADVSAAGASKALISSPELLALPEAEHGGLDPESVAAAKSKALAQPKAAVPGKGGSGGAEATGLAGADAGKVSAGGPEGAGALDGQRPPVKAAGVRGSDAQSKAELQEALRGVELPGPVKSSLLAAVNSGEVDGIRDLARRSNEKLADWVMQNRVGQWYREALRANRAEVRGALTQTPSGDLLLAVSNHMSRASQWLDYGTVKVELRRLIGAQVAKLVSERSGGARTGAAPGPSGAPSRKDLRKQLGAANLPRAVRSAIEATIANGQIREAGQLARQGNRRTLEWALANRFERWYAEAVREAGRNAGRRAVAGLPDHPSLMLTKRFVNAIGDARELMAYEAVKELGRSIIAEHIDSNASP